MLKSNPPPSDDDFWDDWPEVETATKIQPGFVSHGDHRQEVMADIAMRCAGLRYERSQRWYKLALAVILVGAVWLIL